MPSRNFLRGLFGQNDNSGHSHSTNVDRNPQVDLTGRSPDALQAPVVNLRNCSGTVNINNSPNINYHHHHVYNLPSPPTQNGQHDASNPRVAAGESGGNGGQHPRYSVSRESAQDHGGVEPSDESLVQGDNEAEIQIQVLESVIAWIRSILRRA